MFMQSPLTGFRAAAHRPIGPPRSPRPDGFRPDIEGLRAVAVLLVVLGHAGSVTLGGGYVGVDVFFVISGFVITTGLLREVAAGGTVSIRRFYARRALRLIPAAVPVILGVLVATWLLQPLRATRTALDALASATYAINLRLPWVGTDYFNHGDPPSPLQHFWSLAVEEQFYLLWPLLLVGLVTLYRRRGGTGVPTRRLAAIVGWLATASFALGVVLTEAAPHWAYFSSATRAWELAVGVLLALGARRLARLPRRAAAVLGPAGLAAVLAAATLYTDTTDFPGWAALLPVLGTAAVLAAGAGGYRGPVGRALGLAPMQYLGRLSYSWYLWHWPFLTFGAVVLGPKLDPRQGLYLVLLALGVAALSHHLLENPVRHLPALRRAPTRGLAFGGALSVATALAALVATQSIPPPTGRGEQLDARAAVATAPSPQGRLSQLLTASNKPTIVPANLTPPLQAAAENLPAPYTDGCQASERPSHQLTHCVYGDRTSSTTVVLFGDSHAAHWFNAVDAIAKQRRWKLSVWIRNECAPASVLVYGRTDRRLLHDCSRWRRGALQRIRELKPKLVITSNTGTYTTAPDGGADSAEVWLAGWRETLRHLTAAGARVAFINTTPHLRDDVLPCLVAHVNDARACQRVRRDAVPEIGRRTVVAAALRRAGVHVIDPLPWLCTATACPPVVANTLVYRDNNHLTTAYSSLLAPVLSRALPTVEKKRPPRRTARARA
ncbi:acyltransferase [Pilimelia anulata]|uniref:Acyltransferase n=1 Tax=Pilimelia anulata TaxID=53371 RepID=A0A8J3B544_9ACTN|nr:acyltransferase family protein [Pilimelia anulata]GGJ82750.1 acyltransferase [Pilimelia anulata]